MCRRRRIREHVDDIARAIGLATQTSAMVHGSDLAELKGWKTVKDSYGSDKEVYVIQAKRRCSTDMRQRADDNLIEFAPTCGYSMLRC